MHPFLRTATLLLLLLAAGCSTSRGPAVTTSPQAMQREAAEVPAQAGSAERMLIRRGELVMVADEPASVAPRAAEVAQAAGGYVESSLVSEGRVLRMSIRVPAPALESTLASLSALGEVERREVSAHDVTEQVFDLEARLENLRSVRDRLRRYLEQAADVGQIIQVERELTRVQGEIDVLEGRLNRLRTDTAMAQVSLEVRRKRVLGPLGQLLAGVAWLISKLFVIR